MLTLSSHIKFIGVEDDNLDLFEGQYPVSRGISYNSYLVEDASIAIVDTVDHRRCEEWMLKLDYALAGRCPRYLIVQHVEPDHSGCIRKFVNRYPDAIIVATAKGATMLSNFFEDVDIASRVMCVKDNDTLSLGETELRFVTAPMVHWPEVMMTLHVSDGVMFTADAFGSFAMYASADAWDDEGRRYYSNIVGKYGASVQAVMKKLAKLDFSIIAPLHGPVLRRDLAHYWQLYDKWSRYEAESDGVLVAYASIYGGTAKAARYLCALLEEGGITEVVPFDLCRHDVSYAVSAAFKLRRLVLCSVTYDGDLFPAMYNFIHHISAKGLRNRTFGFIENGSWAPVAGRKMAEAIGQLRDMELLSPIVTLHSTVHGGDTDTLRQLATNIINS